MTWYRVYFRKGEKLVEGENELARILARKTPKAMHHEVAKLHTCSTCGASGPWTEEWMWFGSYADIDEGREIKKFCSKPCRDPKVRAERKPGEHLNPHRPDRERGTYQAVEQAKRASNPRLFPKPEWPAEQTGNGWCRWCGKAVDPKSGRRTWHEKCLDEFWLHTDLTAQTRFLMKRDGPACACCGDLGRWIDDGPFEKFSMRPIAESRGSYIRWSLELQVDHVVALWKVLHLPDVQRRAFFGPVNLWLICGPCHKAKTSQEAAERARGEIWTPDA